tara:strand:- start:223 stop:582 length:360 start_codon:yes stop_codon:yes gene_type:complete
MRQVRERLENALNGIADDIGLQITVGNSSYGTDYASYKLKVSTVNKDGTVNSKEAVDYLSLCNCNSRLKPEWLNSTVDFRGKQFTLVGHNSRGRKFPFIVRSDGKQYKMTGDQLLLYFG